MERLVPEQTLADGAREQDADQTAEVRLSSADTRERAANQRDLTADERDQIADERDQSAQRRLAAADKRDAIADARDVAALARDDAADARKPMTSERDGVYPQEDGTGTLTAADRLIRAAEQRNRDEQLRALAAEQHALAALDRQAAAQDREQGARERRHALADRKALAHQLTITETDPLTGARARAAGLTDLDHELDRCRRTTSPLVVAYIDVVGLKIVNDTRGHGAGDELLKQVVALLKRHLRSYDLIIRLAGDEFLCAMSNITLPDARQRFRMIAAALADLPLPAAISTGFAELVPGQPAAELIARADKELIESRNATPFSRAQRTTDAPR
jgi:diguanylate cyclase (GGDEF)-like protein